MKKYLLLLILTSCASPRPGPMVSNVNKLNEKLVAKDIIECERLATKSASDKTLVRESQSKCLEEKGYQILGWN